MKRNKWVLSIILLVAISLMPNVYAEAAVKLDAKTKTVTVGKSVTIKLKNNKKKVKWSVSNGKVRITKKTKTYVKIKGVTKGTSTVKAKVGNKSYSCKVTVKPVVSISKSKLSLVEGKKETIKLVNATASKVKWSSNKTSVATVKSGKVTAKKKGTATITAKYDGKSYKCKVTVTAAPVVFDAKKAEKAISKKAMVVNNRLYARLDSKYDFATRVSAKVNYYDSNGLLLDYSSDSVSYLEKGHTAFLEFYLPSQEYSTYQIEYQYEEGLKYFYHSSLIDKLKLLTNETEDNIMLQVTNSSSEECYTCEIALIYYDSNGEIVDISDYNISAIPSNSTGTGKASKPYSHITYEDIPYDHYEAFISYAYHFGK